MISDVFLTNIIPWIVNAAYFFAILPQIILNYKMKTTRGLSDLYVLGYFNGYVANLLYVYCLDFPIAYRIVGPFSLIAVIFIIFQRFFYKDLKVKSKKFRLYFSDFLLVVLFIPFVIKDPRFAGHVAGWASVIIWCTYQIPQIITIYKRKSVENFSFILVTAIGIGNLLEFLMASFLNYPLQSILIAIRGMIVYVIFCFQFWFYSTKTNVQDIVKANSIEIKDKLV